MDSSRLTIKQKKFCDLYLKTGNATQSAISAGYKKTTAKQIASENLSKPYIKEYLLSRAKKVDSARIASIEEVLEFYTSVMRGQVKGADSKDRLSSAKELIRRYEVIDKFKLEAEESKARVENLKANTAKINAFVGADDEMEDDGFIDALKSSAKDDWSGEDED